jgi:hypothetical protein
MKCICNKTYSLDYRLEKEMTEWLGFYGSLCCISMNESKNVNKSSRCCENNHCVFNRYKLCYHPVVIDNYFTSIIY